jgi:hypothetical protein
VNGEVRVGAPQLKTQAGGEGRDSNYATLKLLASFRSPQKNPPISQQTIIVSESVNTHSHATAPHHSQTNRTHEFANYN